MYICLVEPVTALVIFIGTIFQFKIGVRSRMWEPMDMAEHLANSNKENMLVHKPSHG